jgi:hypothetical protein
MPPKTTTARPSKSVANEQAKALRSKKRKELFDKLEGIFNCEVCGTPIELMSVTTKNTPIYKHKFIEPAAKFQAHLPFPEGEDSGSKGTSA